MDLVVALAIVIGVMGGIATWAAVTIGSPYVLIVLTSLGVTAVNAGLCVGVTVLVMILGAKIPLFGAIPSSVYGYASTAALFLMGGAAYGEVHFRENCRRAFVQECVRWWMCAC